MACQDCTGAVELFGEDEAGEFVGECDGTKRELKSSVGERFGGPAVGWADGEDDVLRALIAAGAKPALGGAASAPARARAATAAASVSIAARTAADGRSPSARSACR